MGTNKMMDKDFARPIEYHEGISDTKMVNYYHNNFIKYLDHLGHLEGRVLDIGERNPLTKKLEEHFNIKIDSTTGDLDYELHALKLRYDTVIFNHVIEHLFNPLFCLERIKQKMHDNSILIIGTPIKPNFITTSTGHFHEMDEYRFRKLIQRAELKIVNWQKFSIYRCWSWRSFTGIRPFLKSLYKCHSIITCKLIEAR